MRKTARADRKYHFLEYHRTIRLKSTGRQRYGGTSTVSLFFCALFARERRRGKEAVRAMRERGADKAPQKE